MPSSSPRTRLMLASTTPESGGRVPLPLRIGIVPRRSGRAPSTHPSSAKYRSRSAAPLGHGRRVIRTARSATALGSGTSWDMASQQWLTGLDTGTPTTVDLPVPAPPALDVVAGMVQPVNVWSVYRHDDSSRPAVPDENAMPGLAPAVPPGLDPVELVVDGERFVVTRRADSPGTYDFDWISHPASYGFTIGTNFEWRPDRAELTQQIRDFLAEIDPETGYLPD